MLTAEVWDKLFSEAGIVGVLLLSAVVTLYAMYRAKDRALQAVHAERANDAAQNMEAFTKMQLFVKQIATELPRLEGRISGKIEDEVDRISELLLMQSNHAKEIIEKAGNTKEQPTA